MNRIRFALAGLVLAAAPLAAQTNTPATTNLSVTATVLTPLTLTAQTPLAFTQVFPGLQKIVSPTTDGANSATAAELRIAGNVGSQVNIAFTLPTVLTEGTTSATMPISFAGNTACVAVGATPVRSGCSAFTPSLAGSTAYLTGGNAWVWIGATVSPGVSQAAGAYTGTIVASVSYTGL